MLIFIFLLTLILVFQVYRLTGKDQYTTREKPLWRRLIYWGCMLFISIVFNVVMYTYSKDTYRLSAYLNRDNLELLVLLGICYLIVHLLSPSHLWANINTFLKGTENKTSDRNLGEKDMVDEHNMSFEQLHAGKRPNIYSVEKAKHSQEALIDQQEKSFELLLNTLCWLAFSFMIFISAISGAIDYTGSRNSSIMSIYQFDMVKGLLNSIGGIMLIFTVPISARQILFYLKKLKRTKEIIDENLELNSLKYQKYLLIQKNLDKPIKKL